MIRFLRYSIGVFLVFFTIQAFAVLPAFALLFAAADTSIGIALTSVTGISIGAAIATSDAWKTTMSQISSAASSVGSFTVTAGNQIYKFAFYDQTPVTLIPDTAAAAWARNVCLSVLNTCASDIAALPATPLNDAEKALGLSDNTCNPKEVSSPSASFTPFTSFSLSIQLVRSTYVSASCLSGFSTSTVIPSDFAATTFIGQGGITVYYVRPSDGKKSFIGAGNVWMADPTDVDWRGTTPPPASSTIRLQSTSATAPKTVDIGMVDSQVRLKQVTSSIDTATSNSTAVVDEAVLSNTGTLVSSISNTYINVDPLALTGSGAGTGSVTFPDHMAVNVTNPVTIANIDGLVVNTAPDAATQTWMYNLKADTSDISQNTKKVADAFELGSSPSLPDADDITQYLFPAIFDDLKAWRPQFTGTCSPVVIDTGFFAQPLTLSAHCTLLNQVGPQLRTIVSGAWLIVALFIVLAA